MLKEKPDAIKMFANPRYFSFWTNRVHGQITRGSFLCTWRRIFQKVADWARPAVDDAVGASSCYLLYSPCANCGRVPRHLRLLRGQGVPRSQCTAESLSRPSGSKDGRRKSQQVCRPVAERQRLG